MKTLYTLSFVLFFIPILTAQNLEQDTIQANAWYKKAKSLEEDVPAMLGLYEKILAIYQQHQLMDKSFKMIILVVPIYQDLGKFQEAENLINSFLDKYKKKLPEEKYYKLVNQKARGCFIQGDFKTSLDLSLKVLAFYESKGEQYATFADPLYSSLSAIYNRLGQLPKAIETIEKLIAKKKGTAGEFEPVMVITYMNAGTYHATTGKIHEAIQYYNKMLDCYPKGTQNSQIADAYHCLAAAYAELKQHEKCLAYMHQSIDIMEKVYGKKNLPLAQKHFVLGTMLAKSSNLKAGLEELELTLKIALELLPENHHFIMDIQHNIAVAYTASGQPEKSKAMYETILASRIKHFGAQHPEVGIVYLNMASICEPKDSILRLSYLDKTIAIYLAAYGFKHQNVGTTYSHKGEALEGMKRRKEAFENYQKGLCAILMNYEDENYLNPFKKLPELHEIGDYDTFFRIVKKKAWLMYEMYLDGTANIDYLKAGYAQLKQLIEIIAKIKAQAESKEDKLHALKWSNEAYTKIIRFALKLHEVTKDKKYLTEALKYTELNKSALLLEILQLDENHAIGAMPDSLLQQKHQLQANLGTAEKELYAALIQKDTMAIKAARNKIFNTKQILEKWTANIKTKYPKYYELQKSSSTVDIAKIQASLPQNTALVEYVRLFKELAIFVVTKNDIQVSLVDLSKNKFDEKLRSFQKNISDYKHIVTSKENIADVFGQEAYSLFEQLIKPCESYIKGMERLVIVPDNELAYLPFEALLTKPIGNVKFGEDEFPYLIHQFSISYAYSGSLLVENLSHKNTNNHNMLAVAATYKKHLSPYNLEELDGAQKEVNQLKDLFPGQFYTEEAGTEVIVKQKISEFGILHFATHGIVDYEAAMNSCLLFSPTSNQNEDGILYAYEITNLPLAANMVVLSACETGMGKIHSGEGVMSLARSFMYAGAPSVVMSLWQVNDGATSLIMNKFYEEIQKGVPKDIALQTAKLNYIENMKGIAAHPAFWAAFVHLGNYEPLPQSAPYWYYLLGFSIFAVVIRVGYRYNMK